MTLVAPRRRGEAASAARFGAVRELGRAATWCIAGAHVRAVPAWHDGRRRPGAQELDTLGFVVDGIWFAGDTDLDDGLAELRGEVDVALVPIWGWGPSLGPGHMDPEAAARAVALIAPRLAIPIHWGTYYPYGVREHGQLTEPARSASPLTWPSWPPRPAWSRSPPAARSRL